MTEGPVQPHERLSLFIGQYLLIFQHIESQIDQMLQLAMDLNRWHVGQILLARMTYRQKVDAVSAIVHTSKIAHGSNEQQSWTADFAQLVRRLQAEGERRNTIVHSLHMFDFVKYGQPVLRSKRTINATGFDFKKVWVEEAELDKIKAEIATLAIDAGFAHRRLVKWYDELGQQACSREEEGENPAASDF